MNDKGSPVPPSTSGQYSICNDSNNDPSFMLAAMGVQCTETIGHDGTLPLTTSKMLNNQQCRATTARTPSFKKPDESSENSAILDKLLNSLTTNVSRANIHNGHAKVAEQEKSNNVESSPSANHMTPRSSRCDEPRSSPDAQEMERLKQELVDAKSRIARMDQELHETRITKHTMEHATGPPSEVDFKGDVTDQTISSLQINFNAATRGIGSRQESWQLQAEDARSDTSEALSAGVTNRVQGNWMNTGTKNGFACNVSAPVEQGYIAPTNNNWNMNGLRPWYGANIGQGLNATGFNPPQPPSRSNPGLRIDTYRNNQMLNEPAHFPLDHSLRRGVSNPPSRPPSAFDSRLGAWGTYSGSANSVDGAGVSPPLTPLSAQSMGMYSMGSQQYQPRAIGTRLSPTAAEFSFDAAVPSPWNNPSPDAAGTYVASVEPMNYRRLLDRNMTCNWKYIVDKIVCNNDQQASIFLQQKLKVGTVEQKHEIVDAIIAQAYPLMINRFGNFLVQRCFEHGTPEQVVLIANAIRGNTLTLSMDAFGCHVIQKAFDAVPEEYKALMVHELLRRIPETVIHRYACHVWQKLFELRWSDSPPQIMKYVNEALRGMWHEVALGETGSLVVQNIFENCLEEDKRPCIGEVLQAIDVIAHGQFGNWCIQHICEHGAPADRSRAIDHILRFATEYSMDQYASKVIEKCLKIGGGEFLDRYLERVCEGRADRPRMPLIDIAGDQFGNYLVQYILTHAGSQHREVVASHVRKHMVSLRGSKYGSRVAMLCCNPAFATRPGPPAGMQLNRYSTGHTTAVRPVYGGAYR
ncbi:ARM repeat-containing protein [Pseudovirgaria hyperparasitica]|uniref:ARM repeat-containing protein n=1 Tax=Pseudovirgaria hyperparasitica TaxID=470096 RepID=A0A6A6VZ20_9PEZI|nr:ARM repeat-containing protein [Pseudovirgaria hyperparasitica]KAF2755096.1 ARM repeat-containing protein [Pseudovirgaria hyperparasitica]